MTLAISCGVCCGTGHLGRRSCPDCNGEGFHVFPREEKAAPVRPRPGWRHGWLVSPATIVGGALIGLGLHLLGVLP